MYKAALSNEISPREMYELYMKDGETYETVAKQLDCSAMTARRYIDPLLTEDEKRLKRLAHRVHRAKPETPTFGTNDFAKAMLDYKAKLAQERAEREKPKLELLETSLMYAGVCEYTVMEKSKMVCIGKENGIINLTFDEINRLIDELQEIKNEFGGMENV